MEPYIEKFKHFLEVAKEVNYDPSALYAKEPLMTQVVGGGALLVALIVILSISSSMKKSAAQAAVNALDEEALESFADYQSKWQKIIKKIKSLKPEFIEKLLENKEKHYKDQLETLQDLPLPEKLKNLKAMANLYAQLASGVRNEELRQYYSEKSNELLEDVVVKEIATYMKDFDFNDENVVVLEEIVAFANAQNEELKEKILQTVMDKLQSVDFGSSLEVYRFVQNLNPEKLGDIYTYCKEQQDKLFEDGEVVVAADVLEYLLENGEKEKVVAYIRSLKVPTHLQELYYRFFDQKDSQEIDFAFMQNPLEISQKYADYVETLITDNWRDAQKLQEILDKEFMTNIIGHDRVRIVIERVDQLHNEAKQEEQTNEALELAKEAHKIALEAKEIAQKQELKSSESVQTNSEESPEETLKEEKK
ncbi:MAG: hypothetical protein GXO11_01725 [Epsilonproteobacteria bacterium]|nr:hypothetical protein [Campylobacterota bacterium]